MDEQLFTEQQHYVFQKYIHGENIFISGPGGSGKSSLIKEIVNHCRMTKKKHQICALTGCAAMLLRCQAKTVHSWSGIGLAHGDTEQIVRKVVSSKQKSQKWKTVKTLIIDEVSMMSKKLFGILDSIGRQVRNCSYKPFGGIQVIFCGDFFQLPPISRNEYDESEFCFQHPLFEETFPNQVEFTKIFRQLDPVYTKILNQIRKGRISKNSVSILKKYVNRSIESNSKIIPTRLCPRKKQVERINQEAMNKLETPLFIFEIQKVVIPTDELDISSQKRMDDCSPESQDFEYNYLLNNVNCSHHLELRVGAQVMCVANLDVDSSDYPIGNGSLGIINEFTSCGLPVVSFRNGLVKTIGYHDWISEDWPGLCIRQIPLILSWAMTIHKSQGSSLEMAEIDLGSDIFECGQSYVGLSRIISLEGLYLTNFNPYKIKINLAVKDFYDKLWSHQKNLNFENINRVISPRKDIEKKSLKKNKRWSLEEDQWLLNNQHLNITKLVEHLNRTKGSLMSRLKNLEDPEHSAFKRFQIQQIQESEGNNQDVLMEVSGI